ncbi:threonine--tRNA ligase [Patescibacteria group bacterium]|nr:threonine--tRNA ligase [Patescibacteria group bacterium]MBU4580248.1 threonine--tRNA ligase [Patescibacteria group bacterium]
MNKNNAIKKDKFNLEIKRHSLAHILASAVLDMFPEAKFGIGPNIENGFYYDFDLPRTLIPEDLPILEEKMRKIINKNLPFERQEITRADAVLRFGKAKQIYKLEILETEAKEDKVTVYRAGNFVDLCRGPHIDSAGEIDATGFKLAKIAGAYWRGDEKNKMLQRIYGVAFQDKKELAEFLKLQEEAEKRDHRKLAEQLDLFMISEEIGKGLPLWLPKGAFIRKKLEDYMYEIEKKNGYDLVYTPVLTHEKLYKTSGHLAHYKNDMYSPIDIEGEKYYLKPMNCPHHHIMFKHKPKSYKDLPLRLSDFGLLHRFERSGVLTGLIRARCFSQNDAHIYCSQNQVKEEFVKVIRMFQKVYDDFNIKNYWFRLSLPDFKNKEKYGDIENIELWEKSAEFAREAMNELNVKFVEVEGEAAFYGPKIDAQIKNVAGKEDSIATCQIDFYSPERFDLSFINEKGSKERPVIIHRAIMGSFDRFFAFLVEQTAGAFPAWLAPVQVKILPISTEKHLDYAQKIHSRLLENEIRVEISDENETLGKKIRAGELQKIPYLLIVGDKEKESESVNVRTRGKKETETVKITDFIEKIKKEIEEKK